MVVFPEVIFSANTCLLVHILDHLLKLVQVTLRQHGHLLELFVREAVFLGVFVEGFVVEHLHLPLKKTTRRIHKNIVVWVHLEEKVVGTGAALMQFLED